MLWLGDFSGVRGKKKLNISFLWPGQNYALRSLKEGWDLGHFGS
jgi:hypothetical protein